MIVNPPRPSAPGTGPAPTPAAPADQAAAQASNAPSAPSAPSARLFIALWPGPRVRQALADVRDAQPWPAGAGPTATGNLHLTLHFIGAVPHRRVAEIAAGLQVPVQPFVLRLGPIECWRGGLVALCAQQSPPRLLQLHAALAAALQRLALPVEARAFRPHVTLARRALAMPPLVPAGALGWRVSGYALVQSMADGRYAVLRRYRCATDRGGRGLGNTGVAGGAPCA